MAAALMATFVITTTGTLSPIAFDDIGTRDFVHPTTVDLIAVEGFGLSELLESADIAAAIDAGHITVLAADGSTISSSGDLDQVDTDHGLGTHSDVDLTTPPSSGEVLKFDGADWIPGAASSLQPWTEKIFTPANGQVTFTLSSAPTDAGSLEFSVNGADYYSPTDWTLSGVTLTWTNDKFTMKTSFIVTARYQ